MLKTRVIPSLLIKNVGLVKGKKFHNDRRVGTVIPAMRVYNLREVDELMLFDITATSEERRPDFQSIEEYTESCFIPLTVGGGIKTEEDFKEILRAGADKVSVNTFAILNQGLIPAAAQIFGAQCVVLSVDSRRDEDGNYYCYTHSGQVKTNLLVSEWVKAAEKLGAGEIVVTSIDRDGTMEGYDIDLIRQVTNNVKIPVIASGGAGKLEDFYEAVAVGGASAVSAASVFHFREITPKIIKEYLHGRGIPVRLT